MSLSKAKFLIWLDQIWGQENFHSDEFWTNQDSPKFRHKLANYFFSFFKRTVEIWDSVCVFIFVDVNIGFFVLKLDTYQKSFSLRNGKIFSSRRQENALFLCLASHFISILMKKSSVFPALFGENIQISTLCHASHFYYIHRKFCEEDYVTVPPRYDLTQIKVHMTKLIGGSFFS